jgi:hypothetical protein
MEILGQASHDNILSQLRKKGLNSNSALVDGEKIGVIEGYSEHGDKKYHVIISEENADIVGLESAKRYRAQFFSYHEIGDIVGRNGDVAKRVQEVGNKIKEKFEIYTGSGDNGVAFDEIEQIDNRIINLACCILDNTYQVVVDGQKKQDLVSAYALGNKSAPNNLAAIKYEGNVGGYGTSDHLMHIFIKAMDESERVIHISKDGINNFDGYNIKGNAATEADQSIDKIKGVLDGLTNVQKNDLFLDIQDLSKAGQQTERGIGRSLDARMKVYNYFNKEENVNNVNELLGLKEVNKKLNKLEIVTMYLALSRVAQKANELVGSNKTLDQMSIETLNSPLEIKDGKPSTTSDAVAAQVTGRGKRARVAKSVEPINDEARKKVSDFMKGKVQKGLIDLFEDDDKAVSVADDDVQSVASDHSRIEYSRRYSDELPGKKATELRNKINVLWGSGSQQRTQQSPETPGVTPRSPESESVVSRTSSSNSKNESVQSSVSI